MEEMKQVRLKAHLRPVFLINANEGQFSIPHPIMIAFHGMKKSLEMEKEQTGEDTDRLHPQECPMRALR